MSLLAEESRTLLSPPLATAVGQKFSKTSTPAKSHWTVLTFAIGFQNELTRAPERSQLNIIEFQKRGLPHAHIIMKYICFRHRCLGRVKQHSGKQYDRRTRGSGKERERLSQNVPLPPSYGQRKSLGLCAASTGIATPSCQEA